MNEQNIEYLNKHRGVLYGAEGLISRIIGQTVHDGALLTALAKDHPQYPKILKPEQIADMLKLQKNLQLVSGYLEEQVNTALQNSISNAAKEDTDSPDLAFAKEQEALLAQAQAIAFLASDGKPDKSESIEISLPEVEALPFYEQTEEKKQSLTPPPPPENNISVLEGEDSPLVQFFAPGPWFHFGKGDVTIGTKGFDWHNNINLFEQSADRISRLPSGFYGGEVHPTAVLLRLETCILMWNFDLRAEQMWVYMVGVTDKNGPSLVPVSALPVSFAARFVRELRAAKDALAK